MGENSQKIHMENCRWKYVFTTIDKPLSVLHLKEGHESYLKISQYNVYGPPPGGSSTLCVAKNEKKFDEITYLNRL